MENEGKTRRQPVSLHLISQKNYTEEPVRQIEYEILYVERGSGSIFWGNSVSMVNNGDFIFINSFEEHYFRPEIQGSPLSFYRLLFDISDLGPAEDPCRKFFEGIRLCRFLRMPEMLSKRFISAAQLKINDKRQAVKHNAHYITEGSRFCEKTFYRQKNLIYKENHKKEKESYKKV